MSVSIVRVTPATPALHVDLSGRGNLEGAGALLTLADPIEILKAARNSRRSTVDWVVSGLESLPTSERQAASFAITLGRLIRGRVLVVLDEVGGRNQRIAGHLRRAGCGGDAASLSVED